MRIALAQINTTVGDMDGNARRVHEAFERARDLGAGLVVFPELSLTGYPPRDLVDRERFVSVNLDALRELAPRLTGADALVGFVDRNDARTGKPLHNAAAFIRDGAVAGVLHKRLLPTYDVFDEARHFEPGDTGGVIESGGLKVGVTICEDIWNEEGLLPRRYYHSNPLEDVAKQGVDVIVNLSASPYTVGKERFRFDMIRGHAERYGVPVLQTNLVGGNDDLIFDGNSIAAAPDGTILGRGAAFEEDIVLVDLESPAGGSIETATDEEAVFRALVLGVRDYMGKTGFGKALIGLSGGIDSSLVAAIAAEALGPENVLGVGMPSEISSEGSVEDARELARLLGIEFRLIPIAPIYDRFMEGLAPSFEGLPFDLAEENLQSRIRGTLLMALSNKYGSLVLSTGNKSEMSVGYCTLYGDMNGGLSVISDVPKTLVFSICRSLNQGPEPRIPEAVITKPPSAELRPDQLDTDSLPPYEVLDPILKAYVEDQRSVDEIVADGFDRGVVEDIVRKILFSEYKRRQAALGLKVTSKAFGLGRQIPIVSRYRR